MSIRSYHERVLTWIERGEGDAFREDQCNITKLISRLEVRCFQAVLQWSIYIHICIVVTLILRYIYIHLYIHGGSFVPGYIVEGFDPDTKDNTSSDRLQSHWNVLTFCNICALHKKHLQVFSQDEVKRTKHLAIASSCFQRQLSCWNNSELNVVQNIHPIYNSRELLIDIFNL